MIYYIIAAVLLLILVFLISWYRVVPSHEAHYVITPKKRMVCSSIETLRKYGGGTYYFKIPVWIPFFGRSLRKIDITVKELLIEKLTTVEEGQARYLVDISAKYKVVDAEVAATSFLSINELQAQLTDIIKAAVRAVTIKYNIIDARSKKSEIERCIKEEIVDDFKQYGLELTNFQLSDFYDDPSAEEKPIESISLRREVEIASETKILNASRIREARIKEAEANELAGLREIEADQKLKEREQEKDKLIAQKEKEKVQVEMEVKEVETVRQAEISRKQIEIDSEAEKRRTIINAEAEKEKKRVEAEGEKDQLILLGEGEASKVRVEGEAEAEVIRIKGLAEAEVKEKLAEALNTFTEAAIEALTAEMKVDAQRQVGITAAEALQKADLKFINADKTNSLLELIATPSGGANLGAAFSSLKATTGLDLGMLLDGMVDKKVKNEVAANTTEIEK